MPYYQWKGINLAAQIQKGKQFSRNEIELDTLLFKREIALLHCKQVRLLFIPSIKSGYVIEYLKSLSFLIQAGILLPEALEIMAQQTNNQRFVSIAYGLSDAVNQGISFHWALAKYPKVFSAEIIQLIEIGQEIGDLPAAIKVLTVHYDQRKEYIQKIRSVLAMPLFTIVFFIILSLILLLIIVPQLSILFSSFGKSLPSSTRLLLRISAWLSSWYAIGTAICFWAIIISCWQWLSTTQGTKMVDSFFLKLPIVRSLIIDASLASYFSSVSLLLKGGMQLVPALQLVGKSMGNRVIAFHCQNIYLVVERGHSLSYALDIGPNFLWMPQVKTLAAVGQESGMLGDLLAKAGDFHEGRLQRILALMSLFMQPLLLIILGLLITGLIMMVYTPIIDLSYGVG